jgi:hypothetical protein
MGAVNTGTAEMEREAAGRPARVLPCTVAQHIAASISYPEDLNHNQVHGSVRAITPFLDN